MKSSEIIYQYRHTTLFYFLATIIPWSFWFAAGFVSHIEPYQEKYLDMASVLAFAGLLVPVIICYMLILKEPVLKKDIFRRFLNINNVSPEYFILACVLLPLSIVLAILISLVLGYDSSQLIISGNFTFSSGIFPGWFLLILAPVLEEMAWHSYGTDSLRRKYTLFTTSVIFAIYFGIWHMPLASIRDYYQSNVMETGWIYSLNFLVSVFPFVFLMNWLYYKTGRSIAIAIIFHITAGLFNELFSPHPDSKIIQTILLTILTIAIVLKEKKLFFSKLTEV
jgi:membrane protease YdiL (CAAX protease family)